MQPGGVHIFTTEKIRIATLWRTQGARIKSWLCLVEYVPVECTSILNLYRGVWLYRGDERRKERQLVNM